MGAQMGGTGCGVRGGPQGTWAWVAPGRVITLRFNSRCVPEPNAEVSGGLPLYCLCGTENSPHRDLPGRRICCPALPRMGPPLTARCVNGGTGGKGRPPPQRTDMPGLHQHLPGGTAGVQPLCLGLCIAKIAFHLRLLFIPP